MVYKAFKPYEVEWRKVHNNRGKTVDNVTDELVKSYDYKPWSSIYGKDYNKSLNPNKQDNNSQVSLPNQKPELNTNQMSNQKNRTASRPQSNNKIDMNSAEVRAAFKAQPDPVYLAGDEEFQKQNRVADHFPNRENPYEVELDNLLNHNKKYFAEICGHCMEDICNCGKFHGKQKSKLDLKLGSVKQSVYKKDYAEHELEKKREKLPFPCNSINYRVPMEMSTINRSDYIKPGIYRGNEPDISNRAKHGGPEDGVEHLKAPFPGGSSYRGQFVSWGTKGGDSGIRPIASKTVANMPFHGKATYKDYGNYTKDEVDLNSLGLHKKFGKSTYKNPLGPETPFLGETTVGNFFKPFKVGKTTGGPQLQKVNDQYPTYQAQYKTIYKDYSGNQRQRCPARTIERDNMQARLDEATKQFALQDQVQNCCD